MPSGAAAHRHGILRPCLEACDGRTPGAGSSQRHSGGLIVGRLALAEVVEEMRHPGGPKKDEPRERASLEADLIDLSIYIDPFPCVNMHLCVFFFHNSKLNMFHEFSSIFIIFHPS